MLLMPVAETCKGIKSVEDWRMTACRFCTDYLESRKSSGPLGHFRLMSLPENAFTRVEGSRETTDSERLALSDVPNNTAQVDGRRRADSMPVISISTVLP